MQETAREHRLLLVAARERAYRLIQGRGHDVELVDQLVSTLALACATNDAQFRELFEHLDRHILAHAEHRKDRLRAAIPAEHHDASADRAVRRAEPEALAFAARLATCVFKTANGAQHFALAVALGAGETEDLAAMKIEVHLTEHRACQPSNGQRDVSLASRPTLLGRKLSLDRPPNHERDQVLLREVLGGFVRALPHAVAQHGNALGERENLGQAMADVNDGATITHDLPHDTVENLDVVDVERSGGLVEQQDFWLGR